MERSDERHQNPNHNENQHLISRDDEYTEVYSRVPIGLQLSYGVGHVLNDVCASMWFTYLLVFFHLVLEFSSWEAGFILLVGQIADALATPFVGFHSDQSDHFYLCRYGKRKIWHLIGTICIVGAFPFIFSPCLNCKNSHKWAQLFYYSLFVIIFQFGWAAVQISHLSLIPELTPNEHDRTKLTAIRYSFTVVSNVLVYVITWIVLHMNASSSSQIGPDDGPKFQIVVWIGLGVGILCSIIFHSFVHEERGEVGNNVRGSQPRATVTQLLTNIQVYQVAVIYMSTRLFVNLVQVFIPLYLHETLHMAASALALVPLTMFLGSFLMSFLVGLLNRLCGRKLAYISGALLGIISCTWIQFANDPTFVTYQIYIVAALFGAAGSIILVTSLGITTDLIGDNTGTGAFVYGVMSFVDKLANGIAVVIVQNYYTGNVPIYYRNVITYLCGGSAILGCIAVISLIRNITQEGYTRIPDYNSISKESSTINVIQEDTQPSLIS